MAKPPTNRSDGDGADLQTFAGNLRRVRKAKGLSQMDLGIECSVHPTVIARLETAAREPRLLTICKLARGLDVEVSELMVGLPRPAR